MCPYGDRSTWIFVYKHGPISGSYSLHINTLLFVMKKVTMFVPDKKVMHCLCASSPLCSMLIKGTFFIAFLKIGFIHGKTMKTRLFFGHKSHLFDGLKLPLIRMTLINMNKDVQGRFQICSICILAWGSNQGLSCALVFFPIDVVYQVRMTFASTAVWAWKLNGLKSSMGKYASQV